MPDSGHTTDSSESSNMRSSRERKNCLKHALQQALLLQEVINNTTVNKLDEAINRVDNVTYETSIQEKIYNQQEVLIDSQVMSSSSKVLKTCTISLTKKMRDYDHVDFAQKLVKYLEAADDSQTPNWSLLETRVMKLFKKIPDYSTLLGALQPLEKKIIVRKKPEQRVAQQAAMKVPEKLAPHANTKEEDSVERTVRKIRKLIISYCKETRKPLDLFRLILHPDDFGRTIRNLLYVSFLIKDGVLKLDKDDNGSLVLLPCRKDAVSQGTQPNKTSIQNVISLNMNQWTVLKRAYKIEQPMIDFDEEN